MTSSKEESRVGSLFDLTARVAVVVGGTLLAGGLLYAMQPDGQVHVDRLEVAAQRHHVEVAGELAKVLLYEGQRVLPEALLEAGFEGVGLIVVGQRAESVASQARTGESGLADQNNAVIELQGAQLQPGEQVAEKSTCRRCQRPSA